MANEKVGFFKNHADAIAIIGVNLGIAALILNLTLSNISSINRLGLVEIVVTLPLAS